MKLFAFNTGTRMNAKTDPNRNEYVAGEDSSTYIVRAHRSGRVFAYCTAGELDFALVESGKMVEIVFQSSNGYDREDYGYIIGAIVEGGVVGNCPMVSIPVYVAK